ncbi:MAG: hypothetical protein KDD69_04995, partial [Bdellovibrionales bacterium]|nr:hypothetical protein [Bdellovibrionales bacterium]
LQLLSSARKLLQAADTLSIERGHEKISPMHLFVALFAPEFDGQTCQAELLTETSFSFDALREDALSEVPSEESSLPQLKGGGVKKAAKGLAKELRSIAADSGFRPQDFVAFAEAVAAPEGIYRRELLAILDSFLSRDAPL